MLSEPLQFHTPVPVVNVWFCLADTTCTVAGLPFGLTDTVKFTEVPLAEAFTAGLFSGPKVTTVVDTGESHALPDPASPWLPLQSLSVIVVEVPLLSPLTVWVTPLLPVVGNVHEPQLPPFAVQDTVEVAPCEAPTLNLIVAWPSVPVGLADSPVTGSGVADASIRVAGPCAEVCGPGAAGASAFAAISE